jgi:hypothetical protein
VHGLLCCSPDPLEQLADARKGARPGHVVAPEEIPPECLDLFTLAVERAGTDQPLKELLAALADLHVYVLHADRDAEMLQDFDPALTIDVDRIDQGPVDVEDDCSWHQRVLLGMPNRPLSRA